MGPMLNTSVLAALGVQPPRTLRDREDVADRALGSGVLPFGAGSADMPSVCELIWTLVVNHHAGPAAVRGDLPWTSQVFVDAVEYLRSWFGTTYFEETITQGLSRVANGEAAMAPMMTGMLPEDCSKVGVVPFPLLRQETAGLPQPLFVFATASLLGINSASPVADDAALVLDTLFTQDVRRSFSAAFPGDWNIPLADADAAALRAVSPSVFADSAVGLTEAVRALQDAEPDRRIRGEHGDRLQPAHSGDELIRVGGAGQPLTLLRPQRAPPDHRPTPACPAPGAGHLRQQVQRQHQHQHTPCGKPVRRLCADQGFTGAGSGD